MQRKSVEIDQLVLIISRRRFKKGCFLELSSDIHQWNGRIAPSASTEGMG
jgi:hypothetical protein